MTNYDYIIKERIAISLLFDFDKAEMLIEGGIKATLEALYHIKKTIKQKLK